APSAPPQAALVVDAAAPVEPERKEVAAPAGVAAAGPSAGDLAAVKKAPEPAAATNEKDADDAEMGTLVLPARASGHRVFVDGRRVKTDGDGPLHLRCGSHVVQIGSSGERESIELPCRGEVQLQ